MTTAAYRASAYTVESTDPEIVLLTIDADELEDPIRVTTAKGSWDDDLECDTLTVAGALYICCPFQIEPPGQTDEQPHGRLSVQNVDARIGEALGLIRDAARVTITIALESDPATPIDGPHDWLALRNIRLDALTAEGDLLYDDFAAEPFPQESLDERLFPGAFL